MKPKVLFAVARDFRDSVFAPHAVKKITSICELLDVPAPVEPDADFLRAHIGEAEIAISCWGTAPLDASVLAAAPGLKLLAHSAGTVKPQMSDAAWDRGIRVTGAAQAIAAGVAEFCLALIITASKRVYWLADRIRQGAWSRTEDLFGRPFEIYRQNVGIVGCSQVGKRLVELLRPYGCTILVYDPYWTRERIEALGAVKAETLDELFQRCRVVSLNAPTTKETERMIRGRHFAMLPEGAVFVNTARGILVDQDEMVEELRRGRFVACLDVTVPEPLPIDHPLRRLPNVILTPHEAGAVLENRMRMGEFIADEIERYTKGQKLLGEVSREQLATIA